MMITRSICVTSLFIGLGLTLSSLPACGATEDVSPDVGDAGSAQETGPGGGGGPEAPAGCDPGAEPKDSPACVVDTFGLFVDGASGNDANAGTKAAPLKTLGAALGKLAGKSRIYLCGAGPYVESVQMTGQQSASLLGGFACGGFEFDDSKAVLQPDDGSIGLTVAGVTSPIVLDHLVVTAADAAEPAASSIALFASDTAKLTLRHALVRAGKGAEGIDGAPSPIVPLDAPAATGTEYFPNPHCPTSRGGAGAREMGGQLTPAGYAGQPAISPVYPAAPVAYDGKGGDTSGTNGTCFTRMYGHSGSHGIGGTAGGGATTNGTLEPGGWVPSAGANGGAGGDGQGGGGGGAYYLDTKGGAGGPGGCGGKGGAGGTAGGSSIGILAFRSGIDLVDTDIRASDAGRGGNGSNGQSGQNGGSPAASSTACSGGLGGAGGSGGGGGGGAGGVAAGIVHNGIAPSLDGVPTLAVTQAPRIVVGAPGAPGSGGSAGPAATIALSRSGVAGTGGVAGRAAAILSVQ